MAGNAVLDTTGQPIKLSPTDTDVTIAGDGTLSSSQNGQLGKIGAVQPSDPMRVTAEGGTLFRADVPTAPVAVARRGAGRGGGIRTCSRCWRSLG